jgi:hypothetical protein
LPVKINIDLYSTCTVPVFPRFDNEKLSTATGFFWRLAGRVLLVTNWHVLSGREPRTGQPKSKDGVIPNRIEFPFRTRENLNIQCSVDCPLHDAQGDNLWMQSARYGQSVDIAFLDITDLIAKESEKKSFNLMPSCINDIVGGLDIKLHLGSDVFITGFPLGLMKTDIFPIWKRCTPTIFP